MSYEILCNCGEQVRGQRQARHQTAKCPRCSRGIFVLPASPYDAVPSPKGKLPPRRALRFWRGPLIAGSLCIVILAIGFVIALPYLNRTDDSSSGADATTLKQQLLGEIDAARIELEQGKFHLARKKLVAIMDKRDLTRKLLDTTQLRQVNQLYRQADLLARLSLRSIEEIVHHAQLVRDPQEWEALFTDAYQGRTILFDDAIRRDPDGMPLLANHVFAIGDEHVRVALEDLALFKDLPLEDGPRLIFGARLARCRREEGGNWVIRLESTSGVLLTQLGALENCLPIMPGDDVASVLQRQQRWLDDHTPSIPARP